MAPLDHRPFFSIVIPAHNEKENLRGTCSAILKKFGEENISDFEILVINDNSTDQTEEVLKELSNQSAHVHYLNNEPPHGFGSAVKRGLDHFRGETVCLVMADLSDSPEDMVRYYRLLKEGYECVFGSRFIKGSKVCDYPGFKLRINRIANTLIRMLFGIDHNDITNAFKAYRREVIDGVRPLLSHHFNITVELPLKAIVRGYHYIKIPISWTHRRAGTSKLILKEMGSRYLFIVCYVFLEKILSRGDYHRHRGSAHV